jgi:hypothetical protein
LSLHTKELLVLQFGPTFADFCKIESAHLSAKKQITMEQAVLERFNTLLKIHKKVKNKKTFFDMAFSCRMKRDVIAPLVTFDAYEYEVFDSSESKEFKSLFLEMYQGNQIRTSRMPALAILNSYAIERRTSEKLKITKEIIVRVGLDFAYECGFELISCENIDLLPSEKKDTEGK